MKPTTVITGASAGIGAAIASEYASRGWDLVMVARREDPMHKLAAELATRFDTVSHVYPLDLSEPDAAQRLMHQLGEDNVTVSGLVNNAGYGAGGRFDDRPWENHAHFLQLMLHFPVEITHAMLPIMREQRFGRIINVASVAGFLPGMPDNNMYNAVKAFLVKFSQNLHAEMSEFDVHVTALCPGFTRTEFHDVATDLPREAIDSVPSIAWQDVTMVAKAGIDACDESKAVCVPGALYKGLAGLIKIMPERATQRILDTRDRH